MTTKRDLVLHAMQAEMNTWEFEYSRTTYAIPTALLLGQLTEEQIEAYPVYGTTEDSYPEELSRQIARLAGLPFHDEPDRFSSGGWRLNVTAEGIGLGVEALRGITLGDAEVEGSRAWSFYQDTLNGLGLTIDDVRDVMRGLSLRESAQLIHDSNTAR